MKLIPLTRGQFTVVDDEDFDRMNGYNWYAWSSVEGNFYAKRRQKIGPKYKNFSMANEILGVTGKEMVDHRNRITLDNRKRNLRICTHAENMRNRGKFKNCLSQFKGVTQQGRRFCARIMCNRVAYNLGTFDTEIEAALAYNKAARFHFGNFASVNDSVEIIAA